MIYDIVIVSSWLALLLIGIYGLLRRYSFIRMFIAFEFTSSASMGTAVFFGLSYSYFIILVLMESVLMAIFLSLGVFLIRKYNIQNLDELYELKG